MLADHRDVREQRNKQEQLAKSEQNQPRESPGSVVGTDKPSSLDATPSSEPEESFEEVLSACRYANVPRDLRNRIVGLIRQAVGETPTSKNP